MSFTLLRSRCSVRVQVRRTLGWFVAAVALLAALPARAEVTRLEITSRIDLPAFGYEKIVGRVFFAVDPRDPHNAIVVDLDKAPKNAQGRVEFSADFYALRPKSGGNGVALVDIVNRGNLTFTRFNRAGGAAAAEVGDGFLLKRGFAIAAVGWEFDVPRGADRMRIEPPIASDNGRTITGLVRARFVPDRGDATFRVGDLAGYSPVDPEGADSALTMRSSSASPPVEVPRGRWRVSSDNVVTLTGGFEPGRIYEITYRAANPPVAGVGFLAVRDVTAWLKHGAEAPAQAKYAYVFGASQSGRFVRDFLYQGFNADERDRLVFDGAMAHIAGAARIDLNRRWAIPTTATALATGFPFADRALRDSVSGVTDGLLDNARARRHQPKVFYTNTGVEYWSSAGRAAALVHVAPDAARDLPLPDNVRVYFFAGTQHGPGAFPPQPSAGQQRANPTDFTWILRALVVAMDRWVREDREPPASQHPRLDQGTLVDVINVAFPAIPGVQSPRTLTAGSRVANALAAGGAGGGAALPLLVPQVDADGNERAGIRLPEVAVPLATYTGWNFRSPAIGGTDQLVSLLGSYIPFRRTKAERGERGDPRPSINERYPTRDRYLSMIKDSAAALVSNRYLLADDVDPVVKRAADHWDLLMGSANTSSR